MSGTYQKVLLDEIAQMQSQRSRAHYDSQKQAWTTKIDGKLQELRLLEDPGTSVAPERNSDRKEVAQPLNGPVWFAPVAVTLIGRTRIERFTCWVQERRLRVWAYSMTFAVTSGIGYALTLLFKLF